MVFCDRFIDKRSRTHDQMVQAARSGVRNISEGSGAAATSRKSEMKLTNVARKKCKIVMLTSSINPQDFNRSKKYDNVKLYLNKPLSHDSIIKLEV